MIKVNTLNPFSLYFIFYIFLEKMQFCNVLLLNIIPSSPIIIILFVCFCLFVWFAVTII